MRTIRAFPNLVARCSGCFCLLLLAGAAQGEDINWRSDYNKARQEAAAKGAPLLIDIGTQSCFWCKQLDARTFRDADLVALLNERFVMLKVDAERSPALAAALRIQSYPTLVFAGPDGKITGYQEGFIEAPPLRKRLLEVLAAVAAPDWMVRDFQDAGKAITAANYARALVLLKNVVEDGKARAIQVRARKLIEDLEKQASDRFARARQLAEQGKNSEALEIITDLSKTYAGTQAVREAKRLELTLSSRSADSAQRSRQARELLAQARVDYRAQLFLCCLDRCELLSMQYADLPEGTQANQLALEIKGNPEWAKKAADQLAERLSGLYFALADGWLKKGQPQQAIVYLERIVQVFPNSRHAETAQARLVQLRGAPGGLTAPKR
jgi:thioredoxin-related protein